MGFNQPEARMQPRAPQGLGTGSGGGCRNGLTSCVKASKQVGGLKQKQRSSTRKNRHKFDTWFQAPWRCSGSHPGDPDAAQIPKC